ncbi:MAG: preprotein translocase subunit SecG [Burkholderiaceae bacterium]|jgi:preprotein translocase subunit SecG
MEILRYVIYALMFLSALGIIGLVLLQHGKGADMGTGFGAGASGSLFGATGSANFLSRSTAVLAVVFFAATLALSWFANNRPRLAPGATENLPTQVLPSPKQDNLPGTLPAEPKAPPSGVPASGGGSEIPK